MNRRDAIKRIGALAAGAVISSTGLAGASNLINGNNGNMKILAINGSARKQGPCVWHNLAFATYVRSGFKIYLPAASPAGFIDQSRDYMMPLLRKSSRTYMFIRYAHRPVGLLGDGSSSVKHTAPQPHSTPSHSATKARCVSSAICLR